MAKKENIVFLMISMAWSASFFVSMISNYKTSTLLIKSTVSIILICLIYIDYKTGSNRTILKEHKNSIRKFAAILIPAILIPALSLLYSLNPHYGALKLAHIIAGILPCIFGLLYIILTINSDRLKIILLTVLFLSLSLAVPAIILTPFSFGSMYSFSMNNWSHVIFARFISIILMIILIIHFLHTRRLHVYVSAIVLLILLLSILISGHKASITGVLIAAAVLIVYKGFIFSWKNETVYTAAVAMFLSVILMFVFYGDNESARRAASVFEPEKLMHEGGVSVRLVMWEKAIDAGNENFFTGTGLGGFRSEKYLGKDLIDLKYPHNLPVEIYAEFGILIFLLFLLLLVKAFIKSMKMGKEILVLLIYFFWLSLFSKDIATNTQLWFVFILLVMNDEIIEKVKNSFRLLYS